MKLIFEQTQEHIISLQKNSLANYAFLKYALVGMIIFLLTNTILSNQNGNFVSALLEWFLPVILIIGISYFLLQYFIKKNLNRNESQLLGRREITISDENVFYKTTTSETKYDWKSFTKIEASAICFFLYLSSNQALIIPKEAFSNDSQMSEFETLAKRKIQ